MYSMQSESFLLEFDASNANFLHVFLERVSGHKTMIDKLRRVLNVAARLVSDTSKFDGGLSQLMSTLLTFIGSTCRSE